MVLSRSLRVGLGLFLAAGATITGLPGRLDSQFVQAVQFLDGSTAFIDPPQFVEASTTRSRVMQRTARQFFTIDLPETADEPLRTVQIVPQNFVSHIQPYRLEATEAYEGSRFSQGAALDIDEVIEDPETKTIEVTFDPPVSPGRSVTIILRPQHNPRIAGTYIFRIITLPDGDQPRPYTAGHARLRFTRPRRSDA